VNWQIKSVLSCIGWGNCPSEFWQLHTLVIISSSGVHFIFHQNSQKLVKHQHLVAIGIGKLLSLFYENTCLTLSNIKNYWKNVNKWGITLKLLTWGIKNRHNSIWVLHVNSHLAGAAVYLQVAAGLLHELFKRCKFMSKHQPGVVCGQ